MAKREKGSGLVLLIIALPALIAMAGLVIDYGRGVVVKTQLQRAADAGCLAGAAFLPNEDYANYFAGRLIDANFEGTDITELYPGDKSYGVYLTENVPTIFMRFFGRNNMKVTARAMSRVRVSVSGLYHGAFPFALINPNLNNDSCDDLEDSNYGRPYILAYGENNVMVEDWANDCGELPENPGGGEEDPSKGWRSALALGGNGAAKLRDNMVDGYDEELNPGDYLDTELGNVDGPISQGREELLGLNPISWEEFDPLIDGDSSRVVLIPIVHLINSNRNDTYTVADFANGAPWEHDQVVLDGFAPFFLLTEAEQGDVDGDGNPGNDGDWLIGYFIPGVVISGGIPYEDPGEEGYGLSSPPRLID